MKSSLSRLLLALFLVGVSLPATAEVTRIAVIYVESDDPSLERFSGQLNGIDDFPGLEVIHLSLKDIDEPRIGQLLLAAAERSTVIKLAAAGGNIGPIAVLYPDIGEPYRSVFSKIIEGIEENAQTRVASYAVGNNFNAEAISTELRRRDIRVVIALGRNGLRAASGLDKDIGVVAGGVISAPDADGRSSILSLAPDPALLFSQLKSLSPKTQRVHVVFDPRQNAWLIKLAKDAARSLSLELVTHDASDLKSAMAVYQGIFASATHVATPYGCRRTVPPSMNRWSCLWSCKSRGAATSPCSPATFRTSSAESSLPSIPTTSNWAAVWLPPP
jgi:putative tryptophan/tyrosine transport system substrate-binding protein